MCFLLYLGTDEPVPHIPWDERDRKLNTAPLQRHDGAIARHFRKPQVNYVGSDHGCGCGFRHLSFQGDGWPEELLIDPVGEEDGERQVNHQQLHEFLLAALQRADEVELYGCWDGEFEEPAAGSAVLEVGRILDPVFHFRERFVYTVVRDGAHP